MQVNNETLSDFFEVIVFVTGFISYYLKHYLIKTLNITSHTLE